MNSNHYKTPAMPVGIGFSLESGQAEKNDAIRSVTFLVLAIGSMISLSSCATGNAQRPPSPPPEHGATALISAPYLPGTPAPPVGAPWPLVFNSGTNTFTISEPQSDWWDGSELMASSAVAVQSPGQPQPAYGVFSFSAITLVDKTTRTATLAEIEIRSADFPSAQSQTQDYLAVMREEFPKRAPPVSLDRLTGSLAVAVQRPKAESLNNAPPRIIIATRPTVLVYIDGPPVWRPVPGTALQRVINTRLLLLKDQASQYYLHLFDGYLQAPSLDGPWTAASQAPAAADVAENLAVGAGQADLLPGEPDAVTHRMPSLNTSLTPDVCVATGPTELITFSGPPQFTSIPGTELLYAGNTTANVFESLTDQQSYILIAGRWYCAPALKGPWRFVPGNQLPGDFANIPDTSPKENVKASVPGTRQAEEMLIANSIPQSTAVARTSQMQDPQIDGAMRLAPIEGTPLNYVVNSATPIIEVDPRSWYACQNGVWFVSTSANGPWTVAASVPAVIYTVPATSPLHYLTYVQVYGSTPSQVYEGYTPGYMGTEVAGDGTVVYGTGYYYPPWIGDAWYGPPLTWGWGFDDCWTPWWGWGFDDGFGWGCDFGGIGWFGCYPPHPWWGGYRGRHDHDGDGWGNHGRGGLANTGGDLYRNGRQFPGNGSAASGRQTGQGWGGDYGCAYNSRTGQLAVGQQPGAQSVSRGMWHPASGPNYSLGSSRGGNSLNAGPRSGGWLHSIGGFFHSGGGLFHGGGGGFQAGGGGGALHGGGSGGGGHGGGGGGGHGGGGGGGGHR